jgi:glycosidase
MALGVLLAGSGKSASVAPPSPTEAAALAKPGAPSSLASQRIYFVMPDRYANGDPANDRGGLTGSANVTGYDPADTGYFHGGDLKGLTDRLQRIRDLGFTALWITPVLKQQTVNAGSAGYHGYWGLDFTTVDPHLGTDRDFGTLVDRAHALGLKVYLDVVVNHTGDVITLSNGSTYSDIPFRDCRGRFFRASNYVTARRFPCLAARYMPEVPYVAPQDRQLKKPAWLNDPLNYHDRGNIDFGSCSAQCFEQGDFFGLDDLFTEKPNVMKGLAQIYASWIERFHVDGFRVDTAKHVNAAFFKLWVPRIRAEARERGAADFPVFGEVTLNDAIDLADYVRSRGLPQVLDFPFQAVASAYAAGFSGAKGIAQRLADDDYFRLPDGADPAFATFLGNHDMGRAAQQILAQSPGLSPAALLQHVLLGYDLLYLLRGAPVVMYGDEVGMIGAGGDKAARQDMFPTQVGNGGRRTGSARRRSATARPSMSPTTRSKDS